MRTRTRSIAVLVAACTVWVGVTAATAPAPAEPTITPRGDAQPFPYGWEAEGYDGTDASLAQYSYDHGQPIFGYGVDASKVYDHSRPFGWRDPLHAARAMPEVQSYDLAHEDTGDTACWVEKVHSPATAEVICGDRGDRPVSDTADIGEVFAVHAFPSPTTTGLIGDCGWVASGPFVDGFDIAPAGCN